MIYALLTWIIVIFILLCSTPALAVFEGDVQLHLNQEPSWSNFFTYEFSYIEFLGHFILFFVLVALLHQTVKGSRLIFILSLLYGLLTELVQPFFGRGSELIDLIANLVGIASYLIFHFLVTRIPRVLANTVDK